MTRFYDLCVVSLDGSSDQIWDIWFKRGPFCVWKNKNHLFYNYVNKKCLVAFEMSKDISLTRLAWLKNTQAKLK